MERGYEKTHKIPRVLFFSRTLTFRTPLPRYFIFLSPVFHKRGRERLKPLQKRSQKSKGVKKSKLYIVYRGRLLLNDTPPNPMIKKKMKKIKTSGLCGHVCI